MTDAALPRHYRRNFWSLVFDYGSFGVASTFTSPSTVIPSYLSALGAPSAVIGGISSLQTGSLYLPQLFYARYLASKPFKKPYILWPAALSRILFLALPLWLWVTGGQPAWAAIWLTALVVAGFWTGNAFAALAWLDVIGKVIPTRRRGRLFGTSQTLSGIVGLLAGGLVEWMLGADGPAFPGNYVGLFLIGWLMLAASFAALSMIAEVEPSPASRIPGWREYIPRLWGVIRRDRTFRRYLVARQLFAVAGLSMPFYMTYALDKLGMPPQVAGRYTSIGVASSILASIAFGWLNERYGSWRAVQASVVLSTAAPLLALTVPRLTLHASPAWLIWGYGTIFFCLRAVMSSTMPGWMSFLLEITPEAERPLYIGLTNTLNGLTALFSAAGGLFLQWTGNNYTLLFAITLAGLLLAWLPSFRLSGQP